MGNRSGCFLGVLLLLTAACTNGGPTLSQGVASCYVAVTTANNVAANALQQEQITAKQACTASEWGKLARVSCDQALQHWLDGDPQTAQEALSAAAASLDGVSQEAQDRAEWSCKRGESN